MMILNHFVQIPDPFSGYVCEERLVKQDLVLSLRIFYEHDNFDEIDLTLTDVSNLFNKLSSIFMRMKEVTTNG